MKDLHKNPNSPLVAADVLPWAFLAPLPQESVKVKPAKPAWFRTDLKVTHPACTDCYLGGILSRKARCNLQSSQKLNP